MLAGHDQAAGDYFEEGGKKVGIFWIFIRFLLNN